MNGIERIVLWSPPCRVQAQRFVKMAKRGNIRVLLTYMLAFGVFCAEAVAQGGDAVELSREQQREIFLSARAAFNAEDITQYKSLLALLDDYPLRAYLEYADISARLTSLASAGSPTKEVDEFLLQNSDSYLGQRLERVWVRQLALNERWLDVQRYHNPRNTNTELSCYALHARLIAGDTTALDEVEVLWNVSRSQVNNCDPVFEAWIADGRLTPQITWQRFSKTVRAGRNSLARYVSTLMPEPDKTYAQLFLDVDRNPHLLQTPSQFSAQSPRISEIVLYGLRQLAVSDANLALRLTQSYQEQFDFSENALDALLRYCVQRLLLEGEVAQAKTFLLQSPGLISESLVAMIVRNALRELDWPSVQAWIDRLPAEQRDTERWQYWKSRALSMAGDIDSLEQAHNLLRIAANSRSYFGFLAANQLGAEYEFDHQPVLASEEQILELSQLPAIERAYELYMIEDESAARNEWNYASARMTVSQVMASGRLAQRWGWHRNSIQAMIRVQYWNDIELRFPLAYAEDFGSSAREFALPQHLLHAVARQESALMHDVRSSAGAMGLMQLMPATGREMAAGAGLGLSTQDLLDPSLNIRLGGRYLAQLLQDFEGNRILATAAYNAGPNRVRQWLRRSQDAPLPYDVWVETIPYGETRNYVESVLTYTVIYGHRTGVKLPLFTQAELDSAL